ncbi:MAG: hypothetical protein ABWY05_04460 [Noviherbaspirillum sp.]
MSSGKRGSVLLIVRCEELLPRLPGAGGASLGGGGSAGGGLAVAAPCGCGCGASGSSGSGAGMRSGAKAVSPRGVMTFADLSHALAADITDDPCRGVAGSLAEDTVGALEYAVGVLAVVLEDAPGIGG